MRLATTLTALALALPMPLIAQSADPQPEASASPMPTQGTPEKVICKQEKVLGSRVASRKTCLTERQWRERSVQSQEELERRTRTGNGSG